MIGLVSLLALAAQSAAPLPVMPPPPAAVASPPSIPAAMPAEVLAAFATAEAALAHASACVANGGTITPLRLASLDQRMQALQRQANGVWGAGPLLSLTMAQDANNGCAGDQAPHIQAHAEHSLTRLAAQLNGVLTPLRSGVWFGTMPLCGRGKVQAQVRIDNWSANPFLVIALPPDLAPELAALTRRQTGHWLAFRTGGRVVAEAQIHEQVSGGTLQISGPDEPALERAANQLNGCAR